MLGATVAVVIVLLVGSITAARRVLDVVAAARRPEPSLFDHGLSAIRTRARPGWTNAWCGSCHQETYRQWQSSRHAVAGTNANFIAQCEVPNSGRQQWCLNCHAPENPGIGNLPTHLPGMLDEWFADQPRWLAEGVDCLACHVRDGQVLVTRVTDKSRQAHPVRLAPELGTAEFCGGCHQFGFKGTRDGDEFHGQLQQASLDEFLDFRRAGGFEDRCHDCHLPDGNHEMPGGFNDRMLRQAVELELEATRDDAGRTLSIEVGLTAGRVGHRVPGGEHFRFLTLTTSLTDAEGRAVSVEGVAGDGWRQVETLRRPMKQYERGLDPASMPSPDSRLGPGETRRWPYRLRLTAERLAWPLTVEAELEYHVLTDLEAERFGFTAADVTRRVRLVRATIERPGESK